MNMTMQRILTGWTVIRALYLVIGVFVIVQSIMESQFVGILFGGYFTSMAVFNYGCAAGACYTGANTTQTNAKLKSETLDVTYEEVKERP